MDGLRPAVAQPIVPKRAMGRPRVHRHHLVQFTMAQPSDVVEQIARYAARYGMPKSRVMELALRRFFAAEEAADADSA